MLHTCRLNRDRLTEESVAKAMRGAVIEYVAAVDQDIADGLDPDAAREWKERAQEIVTLANLDVPAAGTRGEEPALVPQEAPALDPQEGATDHLAPLKDAIEQARLTANAANRELNDPEETVLRGFGKQLGGSRKEILALSRNLVVGQPAGVAAEATRLADEACENIRVSRELIRAALRDMGAASDISEASGPVRARPAAQGGPLMGRRPAVPMPEGLQRPPVREREQRPPLREWEQRPSFREWEQRPPPRDWEQQPPPRGRPRGACRPTGPPSTHRSTHHGRHRDRCRGQG